MNRSKIEYQEEEYWSTVAQQIKKRRNQEMVAGDDDPYHLYKRKKFLDYFKKIQFADKIVLELGCGPGGNLEVLSEMNPASIIGVDISDQMLKMAKARLPNSTSLIKTNGEDIPLDNNAVDISYTVTVLQHVTSPGIAEKLLKEMSRITIERIYLCERTEKSYQGNQLNQGRPIEFYESELSKHGFNLVRVEFLHIQMSYLISGMIRRMFNNPWRAEGEPTTWINNLLQRMTLSVTSLIDPFISQQRDLTIMEFGRIN